MKNQYSFPQRIGRLIEDYIISTEHLIKNKRQHKKGYFDAYNNETIFEIKAAKDNNYFRIDQKNHKLIHQAHGIYILVRYSLKNNDEALKVMSDIVIENVQHVTALEIEGCAISWLEDQRKVNMYYKVKL